MTLVTPWVDSIPMGDISAPLNSASPNKSSNKVIPVTSTSTQYTANDACRTIELIPTVIPSSPIYIKFQTLATTNPVASATDFDEVLSEAKPSVQFWFGWLPWQNLFAIYSAASQTVLCIER